MHVVFTAWFLYQLSTLPSRPDFVKLCQPEGEEQLKNEVHYSRGERVVAPGRNIFIYHNLR